MTTESNRLNNQVRDIGNGDWFWVHKAVLGRFARKLKASGILVYNALAFFANSKTQSCSPTQEVLAKVCGLSRRTVIRKIKLLEELGLVKVERRRGGCIYYLLEPDMTEVAQPCDKDDQSDVTGGNTNNNKLTKNKNIDNKKFLSLKAYKPRPETREKLLALDLAEALHDLKGIAFYLSCARKYPESLLRAILGEVKEIPDEKITKGRAALFNHLLTKHARSFKNPSS